MSEVTDRYKDVLRAAHLDDIEEYTEKVRELVAAVRREALMTPVMDREEREAWDRYAAASLSAETEGWSHAPETHAHVADLMLAERRKRFGGKGEA